MSVLERFRQKLGQTWERRRPADGVAAVHRGLDIHNAVSSSPLFNIASQDLQWTLPLPEDVTHYIIMSYFWSDPQPLRALASSCRCLSILCRPLSFRVVTILPVVSDTTSHAKQLASLIQQYPEIISFIQDLRILNIWSMLSQISQAQTRPEKVAQLQEYCTSLVEICTKPFPALKRCRLDIQTSWEALPTHIISAFEKLLTTPTLKHLAYVSGGIPLPVMRIQFQNIQSLAFSGYSPITNMAQVPTKVGPGSVASKIALTHLHYIDASTTASVTKDLAQVIDFSSLQSLHLELLHASPITQISECLANLQELTIQMDVFLPSGMIDNLDLRPLCSLKRLQVNVDVSMNSRPFQRRVHIIAAIFQRSPRSLTRMGTTIKERDFIEITAFKEAWESLDALFPENLREIWPQLKEFHISYFDCPDEDKLAMEIHPDTIRNVLPMLKASGVLNVEVIRDASMYLSLYHSTDDAEY
ncbi:hypothetical protein BJ165DRAFT_1464214 [Panaeolus papilionaceus]|nr:hypothetical protein BJ165DRAFT_1464214 [Panaeolus papilionaceus]